jgi:hypothetical protein
MPTFDPDEILKPPRLPGPDDHFFPPADHVPGAATIGDLFFAWQKYADGFKDAGDFLVERAIDRGSMQDWLVFPILTVYRQSVELGIKCLIRECTACREPRLLWDQRNPNQKHSPQNGHDLRQLWGEALAMIGALSPPIEIDEAIENTGRLIGELADLDSRGTAFRYPTTREGSASLPERLIDLHHVKDIVEMIHGVLGGIGECALQQAAYERGDV